MNNDLKKNKTYVIDIDGTICTNTNGDYENAQPYYDRIAKVNELYDAGEKIVMFTARGSTTNIEWEEITSDQLKKWGLKYHELKLKKPFGDFYIDDKAINDRLFFKNIKDDHLKTFIEERNEKFQIILNDFSSNKETHQKLVTIAETIYKSFLNNGKLIICGNGGSMSDAMHISAEFTGRFKSERRSLPSLVLGSNPSSLTAIANDYDYKNIFSRELESLGNKNDVVLLITTSGKSKNIINCLNTAIEKNLKVFCLTSIKSKDDVIDPKISLKVNSLDTAFIQQMHIYFGHIICELVDNFILNSK